ncbi:MAG: hypothetical protein FWF24_02175 [Alphaproteobacteria bacterium]|nr:hypothetical protein [Alphaproteobacteria bacterium]
MDVTDEKISEKTPAPRARIGEVSMPLIAQWIVSLAVCVVCCAILFVVFAVYIVNIHEKITVLTLKADLVSERNILLQNRLAMIEAEKMTLRHKGAAMPTPHAAPPQAPLITPPSLEMPPPPVAPAPSLQDSLPGSLSEPQALDFSIPIPPPSDGIKVPSDLPMIDAIETPPTSD